MLETAAVIIGSLGKHERSISRKLGQDVGKFMITEATTDFGRLDVKYPKVMEVILGERNNGRNGTNDSPIFDSWRVVRFGSRGSLIV